MPKAPIPTEFDGRRAVTAAEMIDLDRRATVEFKIPVLELMERAGRGVAEELVEWLSAKTGRPANALAVVACCGRGNNGGDGLVAARCLAKAGVASTAYLMPAKDGGYPPEVQENLRRALEAGVNVRQLAEDTKPLDDALSAADASLDAMLGTGSSGKPAGLVRVAIQRMMKAGRPIVAVDVPSGLHPDTGHHSGVFVTAQLTLTLERPKRGLLAPHAQKNVGELRVVDLAYPPALR
ncbi:MAG: NAD(P)H-hydrate epimerase [Elusimicrobia bacterium]|nr:NAD(P)H-hydrate epimerase [Elusimicrobiota bacterium]